MLDWIISNSLWLLLGGLLLILLSVLGIHVHKPKWSMLAMGLFLLLLSVVGTLKLLSSPPGLEETVDQSDRPTPSVLPVAPASPLECLHTDWNSEAYPDWPVAELLAEICNEAYDAPVDAVEKFRDMGFDNCTVLLDSSMAGYVITWNDTAIVVFRGTDDRFDWFANLDYAPAPTPHGEIHRGFHTAFQSLKPQIIKLLAARECKHLWVTGHSLGGALAVVCAYDLKENEKRQISGLVTFGQPMVVRSEMAEYLDRKEMLLGRFVHFVNEEDKVPKVPPSYNHCGSLVWFTAGIIRRSKPKGKLWGDSTVKQLDLVDGEIAPLSTQQFERLKEEVRIENSRPKWAPDGTPLYYGQAAVTNEHSMSEYLAKIRSIRTPQTPSR